VFFRVEFACKLEFLSQNHTKLEQAKSFHTVAVYPESQGFVSDQPPNTNGFIDGRFTCRIGSGFELDKHRDSH